MRWKLGKWATLADRYGLFSGTGIYLRMKQQRLGNIKVPGILHPFSLRKNSTDTAIFDQVFLHGEFDLDWKFSPHTVIDAGAHIGLFSILMKNRFPDSKIVCVEPSPDNCRQLQQNLAPYRGVNIECAGLWHSVANLILSDPHRGGLSSLVTSEVGDKGGIAGISISHIMEKYGWNNIDVLKIDIEGSEQQVFEKNFEQWLPKVKMIIIELHDWLIPGSARPFLDAVQTTFRNYSYSVCGENTVIINRELSEGN